MKVDTIVSSTSILMLRSRIDLYFMNYREGSLEEWQTRDLSAMLVDR